MDHGLRPGPRLRETFAGVAADPVFLPLGEFNLVGLRFSFAYEARRSTRWEISDFPRGGVGPGEGLLGRGNPEAGGALMEASAKRLTRRRNNYPDWLLKGNYIVDLTNNLSPSVLTPLVSPYGRTETYEEDHTDHGNDNSGDGCNNLQPSEP